jgi:hypothetical protein
MFKKIITLLLIISITLTGFTTAINTKTNTENDHDRWAVIIGVSKYLNDAYDLACPSADALVLYQNLKNKDERWTDENINLLVSITDSQKQREPWISLLKDSDIDSEPTKNNILEALEWLDSNAGEDDVVLFNFEGHGDKVKDNNGDEGFLDFYDEVICPYDFIKDENDKPTNFIRDDELNNKFNEIENNGIKGMFLILGSCFSGGLIDWNNKNMNSLSEEDYDTLAEIYNDRINQTTLFSEELTNDIKTQGRVILTATIPNGVGMEAFRNSDYWFSFGRFVWKAIENGEKTAEEISQNVISNWYTDQVVLIIFLGLLFPNIWIEHIKFLIEHKALLFPIPLIKDNFPEEKPNTYQLKIIGDMDKNKIKPKQITFDNHFLFKNLANLFKIIKNTFFR